MKAEGPSLIRSVATLFSGTVAAQALPFLFSPLIVRPHSAEQFAVFGTVMAVFSILSVVAALRYEMAVVVPQDERESAALVRGALGISVAMGVVSALAVVLVGASPAIADRLPGLVSVAWVIGTLTLVAGSQVVLQQWLLRRKRFGAVATVKVVQAVTITLATVGAGYAGAVHGLELGYLAGWILFAGATAWWVLAREPLPRSDGMQGIRQALSRFREWPLVNSWPSLINAVASGAAVFWVAYRFDTDIAGQHNFARQYLLVPMSMVMVALGQVLFVRSAERVRNREPLMPELMSVFKVLALLAVLGCVLCFFLGERSFAWLFGAKWAFAGRAGGVLMAGYAVQFMFAPFAVVLLALRRVRLTLVFPLLYLALMLVPAVCGSLRPMPFMALLATLDVVAYAVQGVVIWRCVVLYERDIAR